MTTSPTPPSELAALLEEMAGRGTPAPWQLQDGCSWRRIGTPDRSGSVLCPTTSSTDQHPDLIAQGGFDLYANLKLIVALRNNLPAILAALRRSAPVAVEVRKVETVQTWQPGESGEPFWRIEIDGYCADFDHEGAAMNFASRINNLVRSAALSNPQSTAGARAVDIAIEAARKYAASVGDARLHQDVFLDREKHPLVKAFAALSAHQGARETALPEWFKPDPSWSLERTAEDYEYHPDRPTVPHFRGHSMDDVKQAFMDGAAWQAHRALAQQPAAATVEGDGWRPIESAPRDGSRVLLGRPRVEVDDRRGFKEAIVLEAYWGEADDGFAWLFGDAQHPWRVDQEHPPQHWQPLPEPPTTPSARGDGEKA